MKCWSRLQGYSRVFQYLQILTPGAELMIVTTIAATIRATIVATTIATHGAIGTEIAITTKNRSS